MRLSTRSRYGVRALCALAALSDGRRPVPIARLSEHEDISRQYLALLFYEMKRAGLVDAVRGYNGGYRLAKKSSEITVASVVRALEGPIAPVECLMSEGVAGPGDCRRKAHCLSRPAWSRLQRQIEAALESVTIASLVTRGNPEVEDPGAQDH
ncbi:MAG: RrF2 family transcriptional regulator [Firmicutes bacterium]|jgi:Rrf2 family protein|nr:RrF2 family transcriptional regulator [Bacillota bacterium]